MDSEPDLQRARLSLDGLSIGDAFGELFFTISPSITTAADLPSGPWPWTDDTHMALSVVEVLERFGRIEQDALADAFARRFAADPYRGYGYGAMRLLRQIAEGADWRTAAPTLFSGGSRLWQRSRHPQRARRFSGRCCHSFPMDSPAARLTSRLIFPATIWLAPFVSWARATT